MSEIEYPSCWCGCGSWPVTLSDFYPGAIVRINPHVAARVGNPIGISLSLNEQYAISSVQIKHGIALISLEGKGTAQIHHAFLIPDRFLSMAAHAIKKSGVPV